MTISGNTKCPEPDCSGQLLHQWGVRYVCDICGHVQRQIEARIREFYRRTTKGGEAE